MFVCDSILPQRFLNLYVPDFSQGTLLKYHPPAGQRYEGPTLTIHQNGVVFAFKKNLILT